jgi:hypothetical protein
VADLPGRFTPRRRHSGRRQTLGFRDKSLDRIPFGRVKYAPGGDSSNFPRAAKKFGCRLFFLHSKTLIELRAILITRSGPGPVNSEHVPAYHASALGVCRLQSSWQRSCSRGRHRLYGA